MTENQHVTKARDYLAKGDGYYAKAADEIIAARRDGLTFRAIADRVGRSHRACEQLVKWRESGLGPTPFAEPHRENREVRRARDMLRRSTPEQIHDVLRDLPPDQVGIIATTAQDVGWEQSDAAQAADSTLTPAGVAKRREAAQRSNRRRLTVLDVTIAADRSRAGLRRMIELLAEVELSADERRDIGWRVEEMAQALEIVKAALGSGNWDAALAELQP